VVEQCSRPSIEQRDCGGIAGIDATLLHDVERRSCALKDYLGGVSRTTAGVPSGLMLNAIKVSGSAPGLPH
jgi:hypothetical protein